jgi:hypothetical protein
VAGPNRRGFPLRHAKVRAWVSAAARASPFASLLAPTSTAAARQALRRSMRITASTWPPPRMVSGCLVMTRTIAA